MIFKVCILVLLVEVCVSWDIFGLIRKKRQDRLVGFKKNDYLPRTTEFWVPPDDSITKDNFVVPTVPVVHTDPCEPYEYKKPAFFDPERRISEVKCYEFIWELKVLKELNRRAKECIDTRREGPSPVTNVIGKYNPITEHRHMAAVGWRTKEILAFKCGGTLISPNYVMTAASCFSLGDDGMLADRNPQIVRLGANDLRESLNNGSVRHVGIKHIVVHPGFTSPNKYNDIALIQLQESLRFTNTILPACLWSNLNISSSDITLAGYGTLERGASVSSQELNIVELDIIQGKVCDQLLKPYCNNNWCGVQKQICAGKLAGGADTCQGDLGGPLQIKVSFPIDEVTMHYVIGVTSFGIGCARPNTPAVYTRVSSFVEWVESIVWPS